MTKSIVLECNIQRILAKVIHSTSIDLESLISHLLDVYPISVAAARAGVFAILVNKFCKIMKIFQQLDHVRSPTLTSSTKVARNSNSAPEMTFLYFAKPLGPMLNLEFACLRAQSFQRMLHWGYWWQLWSQYCLWWVLCQS